MLNKIRAMINGGKLEYIAESPQAAQAGVMDQYNQLPKGQYRVVESKTAPLKGSPGEYRSTLTYIVTREQASRSRVSLNRAFSGAGAAKGPMDQYSDNL